MIQNFARKTIDGSRLSKTDVCARCSLWARWGNIRGHSHPCPRTLGLECEGISSFGLEILRRECLPGETVICAQEIDTHIGFQSNCFDLCTGKNKEILLGREKVHDKLQDQVSDFVGKLND